MNLLNLFISTGGDPVEVSTKILEKLRQVRDIASKSLFFKTHTVSTYVWSKFGSNYKERGGLYSLHLRIN